MKAHEIQAQARNADDARARAIACEHAITYIPAEELVSTDFATLYAFADGSVLAVHGSQVNAFSSADEADDAFRRFTDEELEAGLPALFAEYGENWESDRGTEYWNGYDMTYRFGIDSDGWSAERRTIRYYYY
jgi:hypothetical protein